MKLYIFPPSARALAAVALNNHLALDCELRPIDLGRGDLFVKVLRASTRLWRLGHVRVLHDQP